MRLLNLLAAFAAALLGAAGAQAQDRAVPQSRAQVQLSYAAVVKEAAPSVVNVYGARVERRQQNAAMEEFMRRFFGDGGPGGPDGPGAPDGFQGRGQRSLGSGVVVDASGLVVTNHHVVEGMTEVKIALADKREFEAEILLKDARTDLAVLRVIDGREKFTAIDLGNSDELQVGDVVLALGNPFGVGQTVTHGIISALARTQVGITDYQFFIQTDAAINPGNSGGALVDLAGRLVGLNTAIFSRSGGSQGIGFAIPVNMVKVVIASAKTGGTTVRRPWLGARLQTVTPDIAESLGLKRPTGALVATVIDKSPAARAGLKTGDLIVAVDGQLVDDSNAFDYRFATKQIGGEARVQVVRGGRESAVSVALQPPPDTPHEEKVITGVSPFQGAKVSNLSPALADELRLDSLNPQGVVIVDVEVGTPAQRVGFQRGDVINAVNGEKIARTGDLERLASQSARVWRFTFTRDGRQRSVTLGG